jgi:hypothetical protein
MENEQVARRGYFRMPNSWLLLDLSPGAKVLLAFLCSYARDHGVSYCSYKQLGEVVGRKPATVSGYVQELRESGLIQTIKQKMANGWNYRLKIKIIGWDKIIADMETKKTPKAKKSSPENTERSIRSAECPDPSGHKTTNNKNNTPLNPFAQKAAAQISGQVTKSVWSTKDEAIWWDFRPNRGNPPDAHGPIPTRDVVERLEAEIDILCQKTGILDTVSAKSYVESRTREFIRLHRLNNDTSKFVAFTEAVRELCASTQEVDALLEQLGDKWNSAWRNLSLPGQVRAVYTQAKIADQRPRGREAKSVIEYRARLSDYRYVINYENRNKRKEGLAS